MCFARIQCTCCLCLPGVYSMARFLHGSCQLFFTFPFVVWWWWSSGILWGRGTAQSLIAIHVCKCWHHPISAVIVDVAIFLLRFDTCGLFLLRAFAFKALKPKVKPFLSTSIHATTLHVARSFAKQAFTRSKCATLHTAFLPCIKFWLGPEDIPGRPKHTSQGWQQSSTLTLPCPCL